MNTVIAPGNAPPTSAARTSPLMAAIARFVVAALLPRIDRAADASTHPFRTPEMLVPHVREKRYGLTHYGIFFPSLPEPHRYCNVMTLLGATGSVAFDNDYLVDGDPRDVATVLSSTAADDAHHYRAYSIKRECAARRADTVVAFGDDLTISGAYPRYTVKADYAHFGLDIAIDCTDVVSWFVRNVAYDHLSLLATCSGTIRHGDRTMPVDTMCTFEYARMTTPQAWLARPLSERWKLPLDFFTYQIVNLDEGVQLLLTEVRVLGEKAFKGIHLRALDGTAEIHERGVAFVVDEYRDALATSPDGKRMRLPHRLSWTARDDAGRPWLELHGTIDSPWRFGHGRGYVASYRFEGSVKGRAYSGRGYIEYVDCEVSYR
ncbi:MULTISPECIES: DUF6670 family protein [Burkholderia]|uniref:DUF6670 family protein n=1 Tax=Burkholderia TaxID=32008 RepID=UPI0007550343|nr:MULTISPECIES: DUF6670 family protein [Burkholderia]AOJ72513.1 hypothetical protein WS78_27835 [Burkholderia savannae]AOJ82842.1 hypothetical protein WS86_19065 [Burkholderia savannae]AOK50910.1 hypothetical protein WT60_29630 [Burkholderia sp. MSMB617WGS]KVG46159.1 hypothetical protein WS77_30855 [Burkholderia sp. MSMB0265]KVG89695.1 hypothetical protein WS81_21940 [Burkholderia sp. MSMB2040]